MEVSTPSAPSDVPVAIRGVITDPKLVGYQLLTNYECLYWRALLGNEAWSLYEVLRSFCHEGHSVCYPSIRFLAEILGLQDKRALIGRTKTVNGKQYRYPGLIEVLQQRGLVTAEVQGEEPVTSYVFHVNLTPPLLSDDQLARLSPLLQKKHAELLARCEEAERALQAKRKPSRFPGESESAIESGANSDRGGWEFPTRTTPNKQYPTNTGPRARKRQQQQRR